MNEYLCLKCGREHATLPSWFACQCRVQKLVGESVKENVSYICLSCEREYPTELDCDHCICGGMYSDA